MNPTEMKDKLVSILQNEVQKLTGTAKYSRKFARKQWRQSFGGGMFQLRAKTGLKFYEFVR